jgi:hypothetical protein
MERQDKEIVMRPGFMTILRGFTALAVLLTMLFVVPDLSATVVRLNKGTEVKVQFTCDGKVSSGEFDKGDSVDIALTEAIIMDDSTIVEKGAAGKAVVIKAEKSGKGGKPGYIKVAFVSLQPKGAFTTDGGAPIPISGEVENKGSSKKTCSYIAFFGLFVKGGNGEIDKATVYTATIAESIKLDSR